MIRTTLGLTALAALAACTPVTKDDCDTAMDTGCMTETNCDTWDTAGCDTTTDTTYLEPYTGEVYVGVDSSQPSYPMDSSGNAMADYYVNCDVESWEYTMHTVGWTAGGTLWIYGAGWQENAHFVGVTASDPDGYWDRLNLTLPVADPDYNGDGLGDMYGTDGWEYVVMTTPDEEGATLFQCDYHFDDMSWLFTAYDVDVNAADCAVWGADPSWFGADCTDWN